MKNRYFTLFLLVFGAITFVSAQEDPDIFEKKSQYNYEESIKLIKEAVVGAGWTIPNEHDMKASMKKNNKEVLPAKILVLCNSDFAFEILQNDNTRQLMSMMPCRVAIYEKADGNTYVAWTNLLKKSKEFGEPYESVFRKVAIDIQQITSTIVE
jgi:uncharacterized protein (DUF302 family)